jgi:hypothetical protein
MKSMGYAINGSPAGTTICYLRPSILNDKILLFFTWVTLWVPLVICVNSDQLSSKAKDGPCEDLGWHLVLGGREGASGAACAERRDHSEKLWSTEKASVVLVPSHCVPLRFCLFCHRTAFHSAFACSASARRCARQCRPYSNCYGSGSPVAASPGRAFGCGNTLAAKTSTMASTGTSRFIYRHAYSPPLRLK